MSWEFYFSFFSLILPDTLWRWYTNCYAVGRTKITTAKRTTHPPGCHLQHRPSICTALSCDSAHEKGCRVDFKRNVNFAPSRAQWSQKESGARVSCQYPPEMVLSATQTTSSRTLLPAPGAENQRRRNAEAHFSRAGHIHFGCSFRPHGA